MSRPGYEGRTGPTSDRIAHSMGTESRTAEVRGNVTGNVGRRDTEALREDLRGQQGPLPCERRR